MPTAPEKPDPASAPPRGFVFRLRRFFFRGSRDHLWTVLDHLDARPALKRTLLIGLPCLVVAAGLGIWGYQHWARSNALRIARQWLDADRLDQAGVSIQQAITNEPDLPATWKLASELAWRRGNRAASADYAKRAAVVSRYNPDEVIAWAEASVLADDPGQARDALAFLDPASAATSARALRVAGEIARRGQRYAEARDRFRDALSADAKAGTQSVAADEVPLGIVSLQTGSADDRARGQALLLEWAPDPHWGADALRALLRDAVDRRDKEAASRLAAALRAHPRCTLGDIPVCLQALAEFDPPAYQGALAALENGSRRNPTAAAQLLGWLTQIGQAEEAVRWGGSLDPDSARKPPIAPAFAEALRVSRHWGELRGWVGHADWGSDLDFMGRAYGFLAARQLGDSSGADSLWQTITSDGRLSPAHALFLGDSMDAWGYPKESADLLWEAADRADLAYQSLGSLARLYQVQRDAVGEYRAFSRLNSMRPSDRAIANNFAYFAALTDLGNLTQAERIAADNYNHEPSNAAYRSTYAFVLVCSGQAPRALALMEPVSRDWRKSPAIAFAYGAALARLGRKTEAREMFDSLDVRSLSRQEIDWVLEALR